MRFLADECCTAVAVQALRDAGHDVTAIRETARGSSDQQVMSQAVHESRILLTEDKDFGQMVHAHGTQSSGVLFLRYPASARNAVVQTLLDLIRDRGNDIVGRFVVVEPGRVRLGPGPASPEGS